MNQFLNSIDISQCLSKAASRCFAANVIWKSQRKTSRNCRNFATCKEIRVK